MVMVYILFVIGVFLLVKGADFIVDGSSSLAKKLGISSLIVGLTVVAFGTSLPELVVNLFAIVEGSSSIAFGNIIGSNIANVLLVLGVIAIMGSIHVKQETVWGEIPFAMLAAFVLFVLTGNLFNVGKEFLTRNDGLILLSLFGVFLYYIFQMTRDEKKRFDLSMIVDRSNYVIGLKLCLGIIGIYLGGSWVVGGAIEIARIFGLSEYLISATIIAVGTSLPELVVSLVAVTRGNVDLAVGNIVGSNVFNVFWVLGIVPLISPLAIPAFVGFDIGIMFLATLLLFIFVFVGKKGELSRTEGIVFLLCYIFYVWFAVVRG
jgi:cation:H+ antiporter